MVTTMQRISSNVHKKQLLLSERCTRTEGSKPRLYSCSCIVAVQSCVSICVPGSGTLCASWQCLEVPRGPPPSLAVQFVGSGTSLSGMDVELVGSRYRMSLVKKRFATGDAVNTHT